MGIKKNIYKLGRLKILVLLLTVFLFSCSQVKFVPKDKYLINKVEVNIDNPNLDKEVAKSYIRQKENYKILGFLKFHLFLYNLSSKKKTDDWLKRIGEAPQIYDQTLSNRSEEQLKQYANSKGFYRASVESSMDVNEKKQKAIIKYTLNSGERYTIRKLSYNIKDTAFQRLYFSSSLKDEIKAGDPFDVDLMAKHQQDIVELFRNSGYYYFSKDNIKFVADTTAYLKQALVDLIIRSSRNNQVDSSKVSTPYYLNHFYFSILPGNSPVTSARDSSGIFSDTISWNSNTVYQNEQIKYPPSLFDRTMQLERGELYSNKAVENAFTAFNRLRQFRFVDIQFQEAPFARDTNWLDCYIRLAPLNKQSTSFDIEGTNTSGNFGVAGNVTYMHRNLFRGAEIFELKFRGAFERLQHLDKGVPDYFNTREFGVESNFMFPKLLGPGNYIHNFERFLPKTVVTLGFNYQKRPEYTRTISNIKFGYDWKSTEDIRQIWNLLDYNKVRVYEYDPNFIDGIQDLYIRSSFTDHLIFAMNYALVYNNQRLNTLKNYTYVRYNIESSGNLLWALSEVLSRDKFKETDSLGVVTAEYYKAFNTRFAQYVKSDIEISHSHVLDDYSSLVGRVFLGIGVPYGNFGVLPFEKKYFTGGANGIRAWPVRSLGPGSFKASPEDYPNQTADIKLEANFEYRFNLIKFIDGALFLDAGNIWAIDKKDNREGALFKFNSFYKQIALGTGTGLRFDLTYFIFRLDLGMKLRDPSTTEHNGWIVGSRALTNNDFNLTFAIGYPF